MRREFAEGLCLDPASVRISDALPTRRETLLRTLKGDLSHLTDDQLLAISGLVKAITGNGGPAHG